MTEKARTVSGMRPTGPLHLGHYFGVLKNWIALQNTYDAYFFVADLHALTSDFADPGRIAVNSTNMVLDWLACGLDPDKCVIFRQSEVREHAELSLLFQCLHLCPGWNAIQPIRNSSSSLATKIWEMRAFYVIRS